MMCWTTCALVLDLNCRNPLDYLDVVAGTWHLNRGLASERPASSLASRGVVVGGAVVSSRTPDAGSLHLPQR